MGWWPLVLASVVVPGVLCWAADWPNLRAGFVGWNRERSVRAGREFWGEPDLAAYRERPYSWMWLLVPIAGIVAFYAEGQGYNHARRREALARRRRELDRCEAESARHGREAGR